MFLCGTISESENDEWGIAHVTLGGSYPPLQDSMARTTDRCNGRQSETVSPGLSPGSNFKEPSNITRNERRKQDVLYLCPQGLHDRKKLNRGTHL